MQEGGLYSCTLYKQKCVKHTDLHTKNTSDISIKCPPEIPVIVHLRVLSSASFGSRSTFSVCIGTNQCDNTCTSVSTCCYVRIISKFTIECIII